MVEPGREGQNSGGDVEAQLRAEINELRRKLEQQHPQAAHGSKRPSAGVLWGLAFAAVAIVLVAFFAGYLPQSERQTALAKEAKDDSAALPLVNIVPVERSSAKSNLVLSGDIQAVTEAPVLARASGYIATRSADIGDHVKQGQLLAEITAPELGQQVSQAKASRDQASSALEQAMSTLEGGKKNAEMARVTAERWNSLVKKGAVARQDAETYQSQSDYLRANVQSLEKAINAARSNMAAADANLARLSEMQGYLKVRAPFDGVITLRNIDTGALVTEGQTLLFRIAQTDRLRIFVNVPQSDAAAVHVGQEAGVKIASLPSQVFKGTVTRTANALDPATRTLLAEVQVSNGPGLLLPGMYGQVNFTTPRAEPPLIIRGDTLVVRADGPQVAVVGDGNIVHYQRVELGRDYGDRVEVTGGLEAGQNLVINPGDAVRDNAKVKPVLLARNAR
ncbi:MAG TPA: efflux RND transporter periplasmic adaptor subunit [Bryobacteraceae bacterium]|jgi:RND family efflux transporter MFP subunit|nr:efflux RND transporter periplasmic adaptor subunit [Bryobacteraceae bacterium]